MEEVIKIRGKKPLNGSVHISGSKNSTVALIPAAILGSEPVTIDGVPQISDVEALIELLQELGVDVSWSDETTRETLIIDPRAMENRPLLSPAVQKLRASYYFMGALLGKYGRVQIKNPGGCYLGPRPMDLHFKGFEALGAKKSNPGDYTVLEAPEDGLKGTRIFLDLPSVGATIN
ncbi:MAG: UDP-N-acetylglucosamine 1-carboxyvinyltransferase, partial [Allobaculum sp.]|nr:UDP-N-acetylglucosamine 1-carboxyvinyltransferase [Allobaculum sp.]